MGLRTAQSVSGGLSSGSPRPRLRHIRNPFHCRAASFRPARKSKSTYISAYDITVVYEGPGDIDRAFDGLNKARDEESGFMPYLNVDPRLKPLRTDPRYRNLLAQMGLPSGV